MSGVADAAPGRAPAWFASAPLRLRLVAAITLVMAVTLVIGLALTYVHARRKVDIEMAAALKVGRSIVEREVEELDATPEPARDLPGLVRVFNGNRHIKARLVDADGQVVYASTPDIADGDIPPMLLEALGGMPRVYRRAVPLANGARGAVILETDARSEVGEVSADAALNLTILVTLFVLVLLTVNAILARALASFGSLDRAFERIGRGDYAARVAEAGPPEFARLSKSCNAMAAELDRMDAHARRLGLQLANVQEEERAELARNLHDEISPFLFAVDVDASAIERTAKDGKARAEANSIAARAAAIREAAGHMKAEVRQLLGRLRPGAAPDLGLAEAIADLVARARARHPDCAIRAEVDDTQCDPETETVLHFILREALSNALQHGKPRNVAIAVTQEPGSIRARISDDGRGLAASKSQGPKLGGFGVLGMRERIEARGGRFSLTERASGGVVVEASLPVPGRIAQVPEPTEREPA